MYIYVYIQYLGPNKETQYFNIGSFKSMLKYKTDRNKVYALRESEKYVSYFKIYYNFVGWQPYNEADRYKEMYEARNTKPSYYIYIEAFDETNNTLKRQLMWVI